MQENNKDIYLGTQEKFEKELNEFNNISIKNQELLDKFPKFQLYNESGTDFLIDKYSSIRIGDNEFLNDNVDNKIVNNLPKKDNVNLNNLDLFNEQTFGSNLKDPKFTPIEITEEPKNKQRQKIPFISDNDFDLFGTSIVANVTGSLLEILPSTKNFLYEVGSYIGVAPEYYLDYKKAEKKLIDVIDNDPIHKNLINQIDSIRKSAQPITDNLEGITEYKNTPEQEEQITNLYNILQNREKEVTLNNKSLVQDIYKKNEEYHNHNLFEKGMNALSDLSNKFFEASEVLNNNLLEDKSESSKNIIGLFKSVGEAGLISLLTGGATSKLASVVANGVERSLIKFSLSSALNATEFELLAANAVARGDIQAATGLYNLSSISKGVSYGADVLKNASAIPKYFIPGSINGIGQASLIGGYEYQQTLDEFNNKQLLDSEGNIVEKFEDAEKIAKLREEKLTNLSVPYLTFSSLFDPILHAGKIPVDFLYKDIKNPLISLLDKASKNIKYQAGLRAIIPNMLVSGLEETFQEISEYKNQIDIENFLSGKKSNYTGNISDYFKAGTLGSFFKESEYYDPEEEYQNGLWGGIGGLLFGAIGGGVGHYNNIKLYNSILNNLNQPTTNNNNITQPTTSKFFNLFQSRTNTAGIGFNINKLNSNNAFSLNFLSNIRDIQNFDVSTFKQNNETDDEAKKRIFLLNNTNLKENELLKINNAIDYVKSDSLKEENLKALGDGNHTKESIITNLEKQKKQISDLYDIYEDVKQNSKLNEISFVPLTIAKYNVKNANETLQFFNKNVSEFLLKNGVEEKQNIQDLLLYNKLSYFKNKLEELNKIDISKLNTLEKKEYVEELSLIKSKLNDLTNEHDKLKNDNNFIKNSFIFYNNILGKKANISNDDKLTSEEKKLKIEELDRQLDQLENHPDIVEVNNKINENEENPDQKLKSEFELEFKKNLFKDFVDKSYDNLYNFSKKGAELEYNLLKNNAIERSINNENFVKLYALMKLKMNPTNLDLSSIENIFSGVTETYNKLLNKNKTANKKNTENEQIKKEEDDKESLGLNKNTNQTPLNLLKDIVLNLENGYYKNVFNNLITKLGENFISVKIGFIDDTGFYFNGQLVKENPTKDIAGQFDKESNIIYLTAPNSNLVKYNSNNFNWYGSVLEEYMHALFFNFIENNIVENNNKLIAAEDAHPDFKMLLDKFNNFIKNKDKYLESVKDNELLTYTLNTLYNNNLKDSFHEFVGQVVSNKNFILAYNSVKGINKSNNIIEKLKEFITNLFTFIENEIGVKLKLNTKEVIGLVFSLSENINVSSNKLGVNSIEDITPIEDVSEEQFEEIESEKIQKLPEYEILKSKLQKIFKNIPILNLDKTEKEFLNSKNLNVEQINYLLLNTQNSFRFIKGIYELSENDKNDNFINTLIYIFTLAEESNLYDKDLNLINSIQELDKYERRFIGILLNVLGYKYYTLINKTENDNKKTTEQPKDQNNIQNSDIDQQLILDILTNKFNPKQYKKFTKEEIEFLSSERIQNILNILSTTKDTKNNLIYNDDDINTIGKDILTLLTLSIKALDINLNSKIKLNFEYDYNKNEIENKKSLSKVIDILVNKNFDNNLDKKINELENRISKLELHNSIKQKLYNKEDFDNIINSEIDIIQQERIESVEPLLSNLGIFTFDPNTFINNITEINNTLLPLIKDNELKNKLLSQFFNINDIDNLIKNTKKIIENNNFATKDFSIKFGLKEENILYFNKSNNKIENVNVLTAKNKDGEIVVVIPPYDYFKNTKTQETIKKIWEEKESFEIDFDVDNIKGDNFKKNIYKYQLSKLLNNVLITTDNKLLKHKIYQLQHSNITTLNTLNTKLYIKEDIEGGIDKLINIDPNLLNNFIQDIIYYIDDSGEFKYENIIKLKDKTGNIKKVINELLKYDKNIFFGDYEFKIKMLKNEKYPSYINNFLFEDSKAYNIIENCFNNLFDILNDNSLTEQEKLKKFNDNVYVIKHNDQFYIPKNGIPVKFNQYVKYFIKFIGIDNEKKIHFTNNKMYFNKTELTKENFKSILLSINDNGYIGNYSLAMPKNLIEVYTHKTFKNILNGVYDSYIEDISYIKKSNVISENKNIIINKKGNLNSKIKLNDQEFIKFRIKKLLFNFILDKNLELNDLKNDDTRIKFIEYYEQQNSKIYENLESTQLYPNLELIKKEFNDIIYYKNNKNKQEQEEEEELETIADNYKKDNKVFTLDDIGILTRLFFNSFENKTESQISSHFLFLSNIVGNNIDLIINYLKKWTDKNSFEYILADKLINIKNSNDNIRIELLSEIESYIDKIFVNYYYYESKDNRISFNSNLKDNFSIIQNNITKNKKNISNISGFLKEIESLDLSNYDKFLNLYNKIIKNFFGTDYVIGEINNSLFKEMKIVISNIKDFIKDDNFYKNIYINIFNNIPPQNLPLKLPDFNKYNIFVNGKNLPTYRDNSLVFKYNPNTNIINNIELWKNNNKGKVSFLSQNSVKNIKKDFLELSLKDKLINIYGLTFNEITRNSNINLEYLEYTLPITILFGDTEKKLVFTFNNYNIGSSKDLEPISFKNDKFTFSPAFSNYLFENYFLLELNYIFNDKDWNEKKFIIIPELNNIPNLLDQIAVYIESFKTSNDFYKNIITNDLKNQILEVIYNYNETEYNKLFDLFKDLGLTEDDKISEQYEKTFYLNDIIFTDDNNLKYFNENTYNKFIDGKRFKTKDEINKFNIFKKKLFLSRILLEVHNLNLLVRMGIMPNQFKNFETAFKRIQAINNAGISGKNIIDNKINMYNVNDIYYTPTYKKLNEIVKILDGVELNKNDYSYINKNAAFLEDKYPNSYNYFNINASDGTVFIDQKTMIKILLKTNNITNKQYINTTKKLNNKDGFDFNQILKNNSYKYLISYVNSSGELVYIKCSFISVDNNYFEDFANSFGINAKSGILVPNSSNKLKVQLDAIDINDIKLQIKPATELKKKGAFGTQQFSIIENILSKIDNNKKDKYINDVNEYLIENINEFLKNDNINDIISTEFLSPINKIALQNNINPIFIGNSLYKNFIKSVYKKTFGVYFNKFDSVAQSSNVLFKLGENYLKHNVVFTNSKYYNINNIEEEVIFIPYKMYKELTDVSLKKDLYHIDKNGYKILNDEITNKLFAVRIPSSSISSLSKVVIGGFTNEYTNTSFCSALVSIKNGQDYDFDKFVIYYTSDKNTELQNKIIKRTCEILNDEEVKNQSYNQTTTLQPLFNDRGINVNNISNDSKNRLIINPNTYMSLNPKSFIGVYANFSKALFNILSIITEKELKIKLLNKNINIVDFKLKDSKYALLQTEDKALNTALDEIKSLINTNTKNDSFTNSYIMGIISINKDIVDAYIYISSTDFLNYKNYCVKNNIYKSNMKSVKMYINEVLSILDDKFVDKIIDKINNNNSESLNDLENKVLDLLIFQIVSDSQNSFKDLIKFNFLSDSRAFYGELPNLDKKEGDDLKNENNLFKVILDSPEKSIFKNNYNLANNLYNIFDKYFKTAQINDIIDTEISSYFKEQDIDFNKKILYSYIIDQMLPFNVSKSFDVFSFVKSYNPEQFFSYINELYNFEKEELENNIILNLFRNASFNTSKNIFYINYSNLSSFDKDDFFNSIQEVYKNKSFIVSINQPDKEFYYEIFNKFKLNDISNIKDNIFNDKEVYLEINDVKNKLTITNSFFVNDNLYYFILSNTDRYIINSNGNILAKYNSTKKFNLNDKIEFLDNTIIPYSVENTFKLEKNKTENKNFDLVRLLDLYYERNLYLSLKGKSPFNLNNINYNYLVKNYPNFLNDINYNNKDFILNIIKNKLIYNLQNITIKPENILIGDKKSPLLINIKTNKKLFRSYNNIYYRIEEKNNLYILLPFSNEIKIDTNISEKIDSIIYDIKKNTNIRNNVELINNEDIFDHDNPIISDGIISINLKKTGEYNFSNPFKTSLEYYNWLKDDTNDKFSIKKNFILGLINSGSLKGLKIFTDELIVGIDTANVLDNLINDVPINFNNIININKYYDSNNNTNSNNNNYVISDSDDNYDSVPDDFSNFNQEEGGFILDNEDEPTSLNSRIKLNDEKFFKALSQNFQNINLLSPQQIDSTISNIQNILPDNIKFELPNNNNNDFKNWYEKNSSKFQNKWLAKYVFLNPSIYNKSIEVINTQIKNDYDNIFNDLDKYLLSEITDKFIEKTISSPRSTAEVIQLFTKIKNDTNFKNTYIEKVKEQQIKQFNIIKKSLDNDPFYTTPFKYIFLKNLIKYDKRYNEDTGEWNKAKRNSQVQSMPFLNEKVVSEILNKYTDSTNNIIDDYIYIEKNIKIGIDKKDYEGNKYLTDPEGNVWYKFVKGEHKLLSDIASTGSGKGKATWCVGDEISAEHYLANDSVFYILYSGNEGYATIALNVLSNGEVREIGGLDSGQGLFERDIEPLEYFKRKNTGLNYKVIDDYNFYFRKLSLLDRGLLSYEELSYEDIFRIVSSKKYNKDNSDLLDNFRKKVLNDNVRFNNTDLEKLQLAAVTNDGLLIQYINNPSLELQLIAVKQNGRAIEFITNPSLEVQIAAVTNDSYAIKYINNPSEEVQLAAVRKFGYVIEYIKNPSEAVQLAAIGQNGRAIKYITNLSEIVKLAAVRQDGYSIQYIHNPSLEVQLAAVRQNGSAIQYIKNHSEEVQLAAVKQYGSSIKFIENPSLEVQLAAVKQTGYAIEYIKNPSEAVQLEAIQQNINAIRYIKNPSEAVQLIAVTNDGYAIKYIDNPNERVQLVAVKKIDWLIKYITNPTEKVKLYYLSTYLSNIDREKFQERILNNDKLKNEELEYIYLIAIKENSSGLAIKYITNPSEEVKKYIKEKYNDDSPFHKENNKIQGFYNKLTDNIYISTQAIDKSKTLYHELYHRFINNLKPESPIYIPIQNKIYELTNYIKNNTDILQKISNQYNQNEINEELVANYISDIIQAKILPIKNKTILNKIEEIFNIISNYIKSLIGLSSYTNEQIENMTIKEFEDKLANSVLKEEKINEDKSNKIKKALKEMPVILNDNDLVDYNCY